MAVTTFSPLTTGIAGAEAPGVTGFHDGSAGWPLPSACPLCTALSRSVRLPCGAWALAPWLQSKTAVHDIAVDSNAVARNCREMNRAAILHLGIVACRFEHDRLSLWGAFSLPPSRRSRNPATPYGFLLSGAVAFGFRIELQ